MAKIQTNLVKQPQRVGKAPTPGADFGMAPLRAAEGLGNTLQQVSKQVGMTAIAYAEKHQRSDMKSDELKYEATKRKIMNGATSQASQLTDPKKINRVYDDAQKQIDAYANGSGADGIPNIRWEDQKTGIMGDAQNFRVIMEGAKTNRKLEVSKAKTVADYKSNMMDAIMDRNYFAMRENTNNMVTNGYQSQEEANLAYKEAAYKSEGMAVNNDLRMIGNMDAMVAKDSLEEFNAKIDDMSFLSADEVALAKSDAAKLVDKITNTVEYNQANTQLARISMMMENGEITHSEEVQMINDVKTDMLPKVHKKYKTLVEGNIEAKLGKAYRQEKTELNNGFKLLVPLMTNGDGKQEDMVYFLQGRIYNQASLEKISAASRKNLGTSKEGNARSILTYVDQALSGKDANGNPYSLQDAVKDMEDADSDLASMGLMMIGAGIMAPDSGVDEARIHENWVLRENTIGSGKANRIFNVSRDSALAKGIREMGNYLADGDEDSGWAKKTFFDMVDIQINDDLTKAEKSEEMSELFKYRSKAIAAKAMAPQQAGTKSKTDDSDKQLKKVIGIKRNEDGSVYAYQFSDGHIEVQ